MPSNRLCAGRTRLLLGTVSSSSMARYNLDATLVGRSDRAAQVAQLRGIAVGWQPHGGRHGGRNAFGSGWDAGFADDVGRGPFSIAKGHSDFFFNDAATTEIYTLSLHDRILLPNCARYQLTLGHLLQ